MYMNREVTYCENKDCPVKDNCTRSTSNYNKKELDDFLWVFTESPGAYRKVSGKEVWICGKQIQKQ